MAAINVKSPTPAIEGGDRTKPHHGLILSEDRALATGHSDVETRPFPTYPQLRELWKKMNLPVGEDGNKEEDCTQRECGEKEDLIGEEEEDLYEDGLEDMPLEVPIETIMLGEDTPIEVAETFEFVFDDEEDMSLVMPLQLEECPSK